MSTQVRKSAAQNAAESSLQDSGMICTLRETAYDYVNSLSSLCKSLGGLSVGQVTALIQADIPASFISSQQTKTEVTAVLSELKKAQPTCKLLYVTPEQLVKSSSLQSILSALHNRGLLARLVIDEVACLLN